MDISLVRKILSFENIKYWVKWNKDKTETLWINSSLFLLSHTFMLWKLLKISKPDTQLNQLKLWVFLRSSNIESNGIKTNLRHCEWILLHSSCLILWCLENINSLICLQVWDIWNKLLIRLIFLKISHFSVSTSLV